VGKRAAAPSEAVEFVVPDKQREIAKDLRYLELRMRQNVFNAVEYY